MASPYPAHGAPRGLNAVNSRVLHLVAWLDGELRRVETQRVLFTFNNGFDTSLLAYCPSCRELLPTGRLVPDGGASALLVDPTPADLDAAKEHLLGQLSAKGSPNRS